MGLLLMLFVLMAAVAVVGFGVYVLGLVLGENNRGPVSGPTYRIPFDAGETQVGGFSLLSGAASEEPELEIPDAVVARVRELVASGRDADAVRLVREETGVGPQRARWIVDWITGH